MVGASFEKAQGEFARGMASNRMCTRNAATEVAAAGVEGLNGVVAFTVIG